ncbi:MAG: hypothetical protein HYY30_05470 [Chloroflexi bacterium]|nr:hypothetical protein [Chloroflexota bacterium]
MKRSILRILVGAIVLSLVGLMALVGVGSLLSGNASKEKSYIDIADTFMGHLKVGDYTSAFATFTPELQRQIPSAQALQASIEGSRAQPVDWSLTLRRMSSNSAEFGGNVIFADRRDGRVELVLEKVENDWKIGRFDILDR